VVSEPATIAVIVVAAGRGVRAGGESALPKQYQKIRGIPLLSRTISRLLDMDVIDMVLPVIHADDVSLYDDLALRDPRLMDAATGGATRQLSVLAGLMALEDYRPDYVLIHDAARPFIDDVVVNGIVKALGEAEAVLGPRIVRNFMRHKHRKAFTMRRFWRRTKRPWPLVMVLQTTRR
jgi:2-C-methyl-D-erythritol 4-phosphate cytidylyltransferase/2-C-methyl-D-erythritol 2,4-cyclodiphosphate synthase